MLFVETQNTPLAVVSGIYRFSMAPDEDADDEEPVSETDVGEGEQAEPVADAEVEQEEIVGGGTGDADDSNGGEPTENAQKLNVT